MESWAAELGAGDWRLGSGSGFDQFMDWAAAWADAMTGISPAFIEDLKRDYPTAHARFQEETRKRQKRGAALLRPVLRSDVNEGVALDVLNMIMSRVTRPDFAERHRVTRQEAIRSAVTVWAGGAIRRDGKLYELPKSKV